MFKAAGLLDTPKETLPNDVWDLNTLQLDPVIRDQIFSLISNFIPTHLVKEIFIIGSITGYKYRETSDIDINVKIEADPDTVDIYKKQAELNNGILAIGTRHPINFFVDKYYSASTPESWSDYKFGNYNVISDTWLKEPPARSSVRDPKHQFKQELLVAHMVANDWIRASEELRKDIEAYKNLSDYAHSPHFQY